MPGTSQLFKENIPIETLFNLFDGICIKNEDNYELNNVSFKKGLYNKSIVEFFEYCKPFYHKSKQFHGLLLYRQYR
jgi:hypothetical protein